MAAALAVARRCTSGRHECQRHTDTRCATHRCDSALGLHRLARGTQHVGPEVRDCFVKIAHGQHEPPIVSQSARRIRVNKPTLDHFDNHTAPPMKTLRAPIALFHTKQRGTRLTRDFGTCGSDIVGEHHDVIDTYNVEAKCAALRGRTGFVSIDWRSSLAVLESESVNRSRLLRTLDNRQVMKPGRETRVDGERHFTKWCTGNITNRL